MKTKRFLSLALGLAATLTLSSCGGNPEEELKALEKDMKGSIAYNYTSGAQLVEGYDNEFTGDTNDALMVTVKAIRNSNGAKYNIDYTWEFDSNYASLIDIAGDENHKKIEFKYPGPISADDQKLIDAGELDKDYGNVVTTIKGTGKCGSQTKSIEFSVKLIHETHTYDEMTIEELYKKSEDGSTFAFIDPTSGKIKTNHGQDYFYVRTSGKLIYKSPDSNWGLLADGKHVAQLYQLGKCSDNDKAVVGSYITVCADIAQYYGNIQLSYVSKIVVMQDHSKIAEPQELGSLSAHINDKGHADFKAFNSGISNAVGTLEGMTVKDISGIDSFDGSNRFTWTVEKDGQVFTIAYDYHVAGAKVADSQIAKNIKAALTSGKKVNITGTLRWSGTGVDDNGAWQLTPFQENHVVAVD